MGLNLLHSRGINTHRLPDQLIAQAIAHDEKTNSNRGEGGSRNSPGALYSMNVHSVLSQNKQRANLGAKMSGRMAQQLYKFQMSLPPSQRNLGREPTNFYTKGIEQSVRLPRFIHPHIDPQSVISTRGVVGF
jgi:hypothetical protein